MAIAFSLINTAQNHIQEGVNYTELKPIITATGLSRACAFTLKGPCITLHNSQTTWKHFKTGICK